MQTLFLVEDDENIRELVSYALTGSGYEVTTFEEGGSFFERLDRQTPDLILLDIMLPGEDGLTILKRLKQTARTQGLPVILLTAKGSELDRVKGLNQGADDYITKPFSVLELTARVKALLRRSRPQGKAICLGELSLDPSRRIVLAQGQEVDLTFKEFELLAYLLRNQGIALSREQILENVWGYDYQGETRTVDMHVMALRQKLGDSAALIQTVRSVGYKAGEPS